MSEQPDSDSETRDDEPEPEAAATPEPHDVRPASAGSAVKVLGVERYVQFGFIAMAGIIFWILDKVLVLVWDIWAEPNTTVVSAIAFASGVAVAVGLYFHPRLNSLATEVGIELSKVSWPTRKETYSATIIVLITSVIAAVYLGVLDFFWSAITDLIYQTKA